MIYVSKKNNIPLYAQIYSQIRQEILSGHRKKSELLPGIRTLASYLGVSRNTVDRAYSQLAVEGYIQSQKGTCFTVENIVPSPFSNTNDYQDTNQIIVEEKSDNQKKFLHDFEYGSLFHDEFPASLWKKYTTDILFSPDCAELNQYQDKQGDLILREELKKYLHQSRGVKCTVNQIVIGCSLQACLDIICKLVRDSRKTIAMEEPGYDGARDVFLNNEYNLHLLPSTEKGLELSSLKDTSVSAVYITPSHQFPYGSVLPIYKRQKLINWANSSNTYIIEDDYDSDYRYNSNPIPSLQSIDCRNRVIYIGTFSKSLSPSLRVNYMILPEDLRNKYNAMFSSYHPTISLLTQRTIAKYMQEGRYECHVRKMSMIYKKRHDTFVQEITEKMGDHVRLHGKGAGLHFMLEFLNGETQNSLIEKAAEVGIKVYSPEPFWYEKSKCPQNLLYMGYSLLNEIQICEAISLLKKVWF